MSRLVIRLLGPFQATLDGEPVVAFESQKVRALLAYLVVEADREHPREKLTGLLWPELPERSARNNLSGALANLRQVLDDQEASPAYLHVTRPTIQFNRASNAWADVLAFNDLLAGGAIRTRSVLQMEEAVGLVRGELLEGFSLRDAPAFEEWLLVQREHLNWLRLVTLHRLTATYQTQGVYETALIYAWLQVEIEPYEEEARQQLMHLLALTGQRSAALAQYQALRQILREELGAVPSAETRQLYRAILSGQVAPKDKALRRRVIRGYDLLELIGEGSFGAVYRAYQPVLGRDVAVKVVRREFANQPEFVRRFEAEAQIVARLEHPYIVPLYDYWREPDGAYLVMRHFPDGSLEDSLARGPWEVEMVARVLDQVAAALAMAHHRGVVHGDVKPANILLDQEGNAYLSDFGIARDLMRTTDGSGPEWLSVSPEYAAPEQWLGAPVAPQADLYSLGILLYKLLTGRHPFAGASPAILQQKHLHEPLPGLSALRPDLPPGVDEVVGRATAKMPEDRFPGVSALVAAFRAALAPSLERTSPAIVVPPAQLHNPYKGLRAFHEADAYDFFGREAQVEGLLRRLQEETPSNRLVAVVGPSGCGKSSLVRAGLIPALRRGALPGSGAWFIATMLPGSSPLEELEMALLGVAVRDARGLRDTLHRDERGLLRAAQMVLPGDAGDDGQVELLLVVDQFEELYAVDVEEAKRERFLELLIGAVQAPQSSLYIVITLRADFYGRTLEHPLLGTFMRERSEVLLPLTTEDLAKAAIQPAEQVGVTLEEGLAAAIVADVAGQPGALPLFQYTLTELFDRRAERFLTWEAYRELGGVSGALARRAEVVYAGLDETSRVAARQMFLRLVRPGESGEDARRRALREELENLQAPRHPHASQPVLVSKRSVQQGLDAYGRSRLLQFDRDPVTRAPTVEIAHEALLRAWDRLGGWLEESRADLRMQRLLAGATWEWMHTQRQSDYLLRGARLALFESWAIGSEVALTLDERDFLESSIAARQAGEAEQEARQRQELEMAQRLAEEQRKRAEAESRRAEEHAAAARKQRRRAMLLAGALVVAVILAVSAALLWRQARDNASQAAAARERAEEQARLATSRELAAAAVNASDVDPELGVLLALEAVAAGETVEAENALHRTVPKLHVLFTWTEMGTDRWYGQTTDSQLVADCQRGGRVDIVRLPAGGIDPMSEGEIVSTFDTQTTIARCRPSADTKRLLIVDQRGHPQVWDTESRRLLFRLPSSVHPESQVLHGSDMDLGGRLVAALPAEGEAAELWEVASGELQATLTGHAPVRSLLQPEVVGIVDFTFSADGTRAATAGADGTARVWDVESGNELHLLKGHSGDVWSVAFSADGARLATAGYDGTARVWDVSRGPTQGSQLLVIAHTQSVRAVSFSPDGRQLATASIDGTIRLWDSTYGRQVLSLASRTGIGPGLMFTADGKRLLSQSRDGTRKLWDISPDRELLTLDGPEGPTLSFDFSPEGAWLATTHEDGSAIIWDSSTGEELFALEGHRGRANGVAFSPDGMLLATAGRDGTLRVWDLNSGTERLTLSLRSRLAFNPEFSPDGTRLAAGCSDGTAKVWDLSGLLLPGGQTARRDAASTEPLTLRGHLNVVPSVAYSPDGHYLATASWDGTAKVWDAGTGQVVHTLPGSGAVWDVAFSPDGARLAVADDSGKAEIWEFDAPAPKQVLSLVGHTAGTRYVTFSPDGSRIATAGFDRTARVWNAESGEAMLTLALHTDSIYGIAFDPSGRRLATGSQDGTVRVYAMHLQDLVDLARSRVTRALTDEECRRYLNVDGCPP